MKQNHKDFATQLQHYAERFSRMNSQRLQMETDTCNVAGGRQTAASKHRLLQKELHTYTHQHHKPRPSPQLAQQLTTHNSLLTTATKSPISAACEALTTNNWQLTTAGLAGLDSFLLNHFHLEGARALRFLTQHPDEEFTAQTLIQILSGTIGYEKYIPFDHMQQPPEERDILQETPLIMTDETTLDQVRKRIEQLIAAKAELKNRELDCAEMDAELKQLKKYLLECSQANGQLRSFNSVSRRPYQALCASISRLRKLLKKHNPDLNTYVSQHLKTSPYFCWISKTK